ncbi:hypothetical protein ABFO76_03575 [Acinetobacter baumannii]
MDPFKIKVTDEVSNTKIQEALFELGCEWFGSTNEVKPLANCWIDVGSNGRFTWSFHGSDEKELTLPQLRDLVLLKRNDVKDATHEDQYGDKWLYLDERHYVYLNDQWDLPIGEFLERYELKPIKKHLETANGRFDENGEHHLIFSKGSEEKDPALISGADALRALADGKDVQWATGDEFQDVTGNWEIREFSHSSFRFRIKPQTIKLNDVEVPAPIKTGVESDSGVLVLFKNNEDRDKFLKAMRY